MIETLTTNIDPAVFSKLGGFQEWHEGDGPAPYVFANKPAGHRAAWSCLWVCHKVGQHAPLLVTPSDRGLADPVRMTPEQIAAELQDNFYELLLSAQPFGGAGMENLFAASFDIHVTLKNGVTEITRNLLTNFRTN